MGKVVILNSMTFIYSFSRISGLLVLPTHFAVLGPFPRLFLPPMGSPPDLTLVWISLLYSLIAPGTSCSPLGLFNICLPCQIVRSRRANCHVHYCVPSAVPGTKQVFSCSLKERLLIFFSNMCKIQLGTQSQCSTLSGEVKGCSGELEPLKGWQEFFSRQEQSIPKKGNNVCKKHRVTK